MAILTASRSPVQAGAAAAVAALDAQVAKVRAVKSAYELALMERAGEIHRRIMVFLEGTESALN